MSAVLSPPRPATFSLPRQPAATTSAELDTSVARFAPILCGGGLIVYGLLRGSWLGLTLAAAGGFLLYRGLAPSVAPEDRCRLPPHDDSETGTGRDASLTDILPLSDDGTPMEQNLGEFAEPITASPPASFSQAARSEELTSEEHGKAMVAAYYRALHRGGGWLPPYEHTQAVEDFCWAAGIVVRQRLVDGGSEAGGFSVP